MPESEFPAEPAVNESAAALARWRGWRHPALLALLATILLLGAALGWPLLRALWLPPAAQAPAQGLPWQIRPDGAGGSEVFGLKLGRATLSDVESLWGQDLKVALIAAPGQPPALEAYVEGFQAAFVTGKMVLAFDAKADWLAGAWARAPRHDIGAGAVRQHELSMDDLAIARSLKASALSFVPAARLDEATVLQRFGPAAERLVGPAGELQLLYPALGVAVALPPEQATTPEGERVGKALIQYVAPAEFEARLRAPLLRAQAAGAASAPTRP